jgi:hypothetical protein
MLSPARAVALIAGLAALAALGGCDDPDTSVAADAARDSAGADTARADSAATADAAGVDGRGPDGAGDGGAEAGGDGTSGVDCMPAVHPGTITFVNADTGESNVDPVEAVPDSVRWRTTAQGRVPVVKVVRRSVGGQIEIALYGPCGQLLEVTLGEAGSASSDASPE